MKSRKNNINQDDKIKDQALFHLYKSVICLSIKRKKDILHKQNLTTYYV